MVDLEVMTPAFARGWAELPNELRHQVLLNFLGSVLPYADRCFFAVGYLVHEPRARPTDPAFPWPFVYDEEPRDRTVSHQVVGQAKLCDAPSQAEKRRDIERKVLNFAKAYGQSEMLVAIAKVKKHIRDKLRVVEGDRSWERHMYLPAEESRKIYVWWANASEQGHWLDRLDQIVGIESLNLAYDRWYELECCSLRERRFCTCDFSCRYRMITEEGA